MPERAKSAPNATKTMLVAFFMPGGLQWVLNGVERV